MAELDDKELEWLNGIFKKVEIFDGLGGHHIKKLISHVQKFSFKKDKPIFKQGDSPEAFFIIYQGSVKVMMKRMLRKDVEAALLKSGDFFGEMAFLTYKPRTASVIAIEPTVCFVLFKASFQTLLKDNASFKHDLQTVAFKRALELRKI